VAAAGRRGVNHVTTQGRRCRKRPSDIVEDGSVLPSRSGVGRRIGQGAAGQAAQVAGLGVGTPVGARDNRSRLQRLVRGILFGCDLSAEAYASGAVETPRAGSK
jgi:hypothetical protein